MTKQRRTLASCCAAHTVHDGFSDVTYVLLPLLAQTFGLSLAQVGMIRSAHRVAMAAFQIPAGLIAERFGERNLLALGTYNFFGDVGKFAFGGIVSLLLFAGISWQAPVVGFGLLGVATAIAIFFFVANTREEKLIKGQTKPAAKSAGWGIQNPQGFTALCLIEILDSSTRTGFLTFIAFVLIAKGMPDGWAVLSVPLILVGGMVGKLACGFLAERLGIARMIIITEVATGCGILATLALPGAVSFLLLPLIGVVLNGTSSVLYATLGDFVEPDRLPRAFGLFYTLGSLCGIAAPLGYGLIGDLYGIETAFAIIGTAIFFTVPLAALMKPGAATRLKSA